MIKRTFVVCVIKNTEYISMKLSESDKQINVKDVRKQIQNCNQIHIKK